MGGSSASARGVEIGQLRQRRDFRAEFAQGGDGMFLQRGTQLGQLLERLAQRDQVAGVAAALHETRDEPFEVADFAQALLQDIAFGLVGAGPGDHALPALDRGHVAQRREQPLAQEASAAGGDGAVDGAEQRGVFRPGPERIDDLQVAARGGVENEDILALPETQAVNMAELAAQLVTEIMHQPAPRR